MHTFSIYGQKLIFQGNCFVFLDSQTHPHHISHSKWVFQIISIPIKKKKYIIYPNKNNIIFESDNYFSKIFWRNLLDNLARYGWCHISCILNYIVSIVENKKLYKFCCWSDLNRRRTISAIFSLIIPLFRFLIRCCCIWGWLEMHHNMGIEIWLMRECVMRCPLIVLLRLDNLPPEMRENLFYF